jgi:hypothetical protein
VRSVDVLGADPVLSPDIAAAVTHLYYFATPPIRQSQRSGFDDALFQQFAAFYVAGFIRVCRTLGAERPLRVYYPSTVFIDDPPEGFREYVAAKRAGEDACAAVRRERPGVTVVVDRLARTRTDQTSSLLDRGGQDAGSVMLAALRRAASFE